MNNILYLYSTNELKELRKMLLIVRGRIRNCGRKEKDSKKGRGIVIGWGKERGRYRKGGGGGWDTGGLM